MQEDKNTQEQIGPPFFSAWWRLYALVLGIHILCILLFYLFTLVLNIANG